MKLIWSQSSVCIGRLTCHSKTNIMSWISQQCMSTSMSFTWTYLDHFFPSVASAVTSQQELSTERLWCWEIVLGLRFKAPVILYTCAVHAAGLRQDICETCTTRCHGSTKTFKVEARNLRATDGTFDFFNILNELCKWFEGYFVSWSLEKSN